MSRSQSTMALWYPSLLDIFQNSRHLLSVLFFFFIAGVFRIIIRINFTFILAVNVLAIFEFLFFIGWANVTSSHDTHYLLVVIKDAETRLLGLFFQVNTKLVVFDHVFWLTTLFLLFLQIFEYWIGYFCWLWFLVSVFVYRSSQRLCWCWNKISK